MSAPAFFTLMNPEMGESPDTENPTEDAAEGSGESYTLPSDAVPEGTKEGDTLTFHVESVGDDGTVTATCESGDREKGSVNWRDELRKNMPDTGM